MIVCVNVYHVIIAVYFLIGSVISIAQFRQQKGKVGNVRAFFLAVIVGIFWIIFAILIPFTGGAREQK